MRVVFMNWAPIWKGAEQGGGVNGYLHSLAPALVARGHEVTSIFSGLLYTSADGDPFTRRHDDFHGVRVLEIINSPVLAPSAAQFREPLAEISAPRLEAEFGRLLDMLKPDVCHWHNLEGFSVGCIDVCRHAGARTVFSLHNYHTLCSQVTLSRGHRRPCTNFHGGVSCVTCIDAPDPTSERHRRVAEFHAAASAKQEDARRRFADHIRQVRHELAWPVRAARAARHAWSASRRLRDAEARVEPVVLPGSSTTDAEQLAIAREPVPAERAPSPTFVSLTAHTTDAEYQQRGGPPLSNDPAGDPTSGRTRNAYASRRAHMIAALNRCDRVLGVSDFVRDKYIAEGVEPSIIETRRIGTIAAESPMPAVPPPAGGPIRVLAIGFNHFNKGIPLLLAAMREMPGESLRSIGLTLCARGIRDIGPAFRALHPPLAELHVIDGYRSSDLPRLMRGHDLCYVGSTWWDPLPQTVLEAHAFGVPVIGARAGGIPEVVTDGENGFTFQANNPGALRQTLHRAIASASDGARWPRRILPPTSISRHAKELEALYAALQSRASPPTSASHDHSARSVQTGPPVRVPSTVPPS